MFGWRTELRSLRDEPPSNDLQSKTTEKFAGLLLGNDRAFEPRRVGELETVEIGAAQVGSFKARLCPVRLPQASTGQHGVPEVGVAEIGA